MTNTYRAGRLDLRSIREGHCRNGFTGVKPGMPAPCLGKDPRGILSKPPRYADRLMRFCHMLVAQALEFFQ